MRAFLKFGGALALLALLVRPVFACCDVVVGTVTCTKSGQTRNWSVPVTWKYDASSAGTLKLYIDSIETDSESITGIGCNTGTSVTMTGSSTTDPVNVTAKLYPSGSTNPSCQDDDGLKSCSS